MVMGIAEQIGGYYYGEYTIKQSYGGDAYTGIQNAASATANNVERLGYLIDGVVEQLYVICGIACMIIALYWFACALASSDKKAAPKTETALDTLTKYKNLLDSGVITQEEFETMKQQLLNV